MSDDAHKNEHGAAPAGDAHGGGGGGGHKGGHGGGGHGHGGGGGHAEHEEGVPEWVVSFADNALLQMGFFVILFAMNVGPKSGGAGESQHAGASAGYLDSVIAIREAFNNPVSLDSKDPNDLPLIRRMLERGVPGDGHTNGPKGEKQDVQAIRPTGYSENNGLVSFDLNQTTVSASSREELADLAKRLKGQRWIVEVRGHCSSAEAMGDPAKGMAISYERSRNVALTLVEQGLTWAQVRLTAASDNERVVAKAYDAAAHRSNQRVEVIVTADQMAPDPYTKEGE